MQKMYYVPLIMNEGIFLYGTSFCLLRYIDVNSYYFTKKIIRNMKRRMQKLSLLKPDIFFKRNIHV